VTPMMAVQINLARPQGPLPSLQTRTTPLAGGRSARGLWSQSLGGWLAKAMLFTRIAPVGPVIQMCDPLENARHSRVGASGRDGHFALACGGTSDRQRTSHGPLYSPGKHNPERAPPEGATRPVENTAPGVGLYESDAARLNAVLSHAGGRAAETGYGEMVGWRKLWPCHSHAQARLALSRLRSRRSFANRACSRSPFSLSSRSSCRNSGVIKTLGPD